VRAIPYHVVLIESHDDSREMYLEWLTWCGIRVTAVPTASDALGAVRHTFPDAVVACLRLSDGAAFGLIDAIDRLSDGARIPVVVLSTCIGDYERAISDELIDTVLMKPCLPSELHDALLDALRRDRTAP
jgi:CheY-like chemotaxis protein